MPHGDRVSAAELLDQALATSHDRLATELHSDTSTALAYARALWALEDELRQLAARLHEGDLP